MQGTRRNVSHPAALFLPLLNKAIAPSCAWGHHTATLDALGASSSLLSSPFLPPLCILLSFPSCMLSHPSLGPQKPFLSCPLLMAYPADDLPSKMLGGS